MEIAQAMSTALMAGTLLAGSEPLNGFAGDRQGRAPARAGALHDSGSASIRG
jgi:hypothetical protein